MVLELGLISFGFIFSCAWGDFVVSTGGGLGGVGFVSVCVGPEVSSMDEMLRACAVGDGFHALHWNMLSWLGFGHSACLCLAVVCLIRDVIGGLGF